MVKRLGKGLYLFAALLAGLSGAACSKKTADPLCSDQPAPQTLELKSGQGALQVLAAGEGYFYVFDDAGKQISYGGINRALPIKAGRYTVKVNNSPHPVVVESKTLTKCNCGTLVVAGNTDEYYYVLDDAKTQLGYHKLGGPLPFFPGTYTVKVNNTTAPATVNPGGTTNLKTGVLNTQGTTDEYYYVFDSTGTQLAYNKLSRPLSFLPGAVTVKVNNTAGPANITAGNPTEVRTGAMVVQGTTDEYYYVFDTVGNQLAYNKLGRPLSFMPGSYSTKVNNAAMPATVDAGRTNEYQTGTLTVKGSGSDYYYVLDPNGTQLGYKKLNEPMSLVAGKYSVKVGQQTRPAEVTAGQATVVNW